MEISLETSEVIPSKFKDLEELFGPSGAYFGCWCMYRRIKKKSFFSCGPDERKEKMVNLVNSGDVPGIILYENGVPAGWVSIAPVEQFSGLFNSHFRKPRSMTGLWTISCFFVGRQFRGRGYMEALLKGAIDLAIRRGASAIIAYPVETEQRIDPSYLYTGKTSLFRRAGFIDVDSERKSRDRKIMILNLKKWEKDYSSFLEERR